MSQPVGSAGDSFPHAASARMSASCTASSAVAKSAPRRTRTLNTRGTSSRSPTSFMGLRPPVLHHARLGVWRTARTGGSAPSCPPSVGEVWRRGHEGSDLEPFVDGFAAGARCGRQLTGELDGALAAVYVYHHPPRDQVLRLGERAVGHCRPPFAVRADPHA